MFPQNKVGLCVGCYVVITWRIATKIQHMQGEGITKSVKEQSWSLLDVETVCETLGSILHTVGEKMASFSAASQKLDNYF